jgi:glyoxylase-like metal-dependent hydrolase (beta-lactamase superfamily II)
MRTRLLHCLSAALTTFFLTAPAMAQMPDWDEIEIRTTDIGDGIYTLEGMGGTIGISVGDDGVFVIDDQFQPLADKILAAIAAVTDKPVRFVINTHWHGDHTGANAEMAAAGGVLVAHDNVRVRMAAEGPQQADEAALPIVTFSDSVTFHFNGHEIAVLHPVDAHTDGDAVVHFVDIDVIHAGDILFNGVYPYIDLGSGGSIDGFLHAMRVIESMAGPDTRIIAGHGKVAATKADIRKNIEMLEITSERIQALIDDGKSLEEIKAADPLADYNDEYTWSFINGERFTEILYGGLVED